MSDSDISTIAVPTFNTADLTDAVEAVRDALASTPKARDTSAARHLRSLIETLRSLGL